MSDPYPGTGRHRRYTRRGLLPLLLGQLATGLAAAALLGTATPAAADPSADAWYRLRVCESGNNYRTNTGNGYYGAYQFSAGTWHAYGGRGLPSDAPPAEQDLRAKLLYRASGWSPWPACSRKLGLGSDPSYGRIDPAAQRAASRPATRHATQPAARHRAVATQPAPAHRATHRRHTRVTIPAAHHPVTTRAATARPARLAVWSTPDGGRWGRSAALLIPRTGAWQGLVRIPVAAFTYLPRWAAQVRPL